MTKYFYQMYPTEAQQKELEHTLDLCRVVYNEMIGVHKDIWVKERRKTPLTEAYYILNYWLDLNPELRTVYKGSLQNATRHVHYVFMSFYKFVNTATPLPFPECVGLGEYTHVSYLNHTAYVRGDTLTLPKVGVIPIKPPRDRYEPLRAPRRRTTVYLRSGHIWKVVVNT